MSSEEESDAPMCNDDDYDEYDVISPKKKPRLLHRRNLRAVKKGLSVDSFNPETLTTHTEELKRIERLEHPQIHNNDLATGSGTTVGIASSSSTENGIIVLSDSDDDGGDGKAAVRKPYYRQSSTRKYSESLPLVDGKLVVNLGHPSNEQDIHLPPQIALVAKPHQVGGIRFLYDNIVESLSRYNDSQGFGCILAHSMGLGKTLQVIAFVDVFLHYTHSQHVLCVVPINTVQNWVTEFNMWLPKATDIDPSSLLNSVTNCFDQSLTTLKPRNFDVFVLNDSAKTLVSRVAIIKKWRSKGGVLIIGYEMFRLLSLSVPCIGGNKMAVKKKSKTSTASQNIIIDLDETEKEMEQLMEVQAALCNPGPDLVVCDEGHVIRNDNTQISKALKNISTKRRVVTTGYPLQNNLLEYWCMVDFVRPNYLGTRQEFQNLFERPIQNGQCVDSTPMDVQLMRQRSHVLHTLLKGFVLRKGHEILHKVLPKKYEHVLLLRMSSVQQLLYQHVTKLLQQKHGKTNPINPIKAYSVYSKVWNHPDIYQRACASGSSHLAEFDGEVLLRGNSNNDYLIWPNSEYLQNYQSGMIINSTKMFLLKHIIDLSVHVGDKILVYSHSLLSLNTIEELLSKSTVPIPCQTGGIQYSSINWERSTNYLRLDGSTSAQEREKLINKFNTSNDVWVFLLSTKAGCLGINLVGANRVVVLDVSWNPCHDVQAVCRVYRYGQKKNCHIYRMVSDGTLERRIYNRQISKQGMSDRIVDELNPERCLSKSEIASLMAPLVRTNVASCCQHLIFIPSHPWHPQLTFTRMK